MQLNNKGFVELSLNLPNKNIDVNTFYIAPVDSKGLVLPGGVIHKFSTVKKVCLPKGKYNVQVLGKDKNTYYNIYKGNVNVSKPKNVLEVRSGDMAAVKISAVSSSKNNFLINYVWAHPLEIEFNRFYYNGNNPTSSYPLQITKGDYRRINVLATLNNY